ncbi:TPA: hypothetical protein QCZ17_002982 [Bacillus cereus]|nr:hypothetical protein [Bacillus cereus]
MSYYTYVPGYPAFPYFYNNPYYDDRIAYSMNAYYGYFPYYIYRNYLFPPYSYSENSDFHEDSRQITGPFILWHNSSTGGIQIWFMKGHRLNRWATVIGDNGNPAFIGPPWSIVGVGHFDSDGKSDIVWHNSSTGEIQIWFMEGHKLNRRATVIGDNGNPAFIGPPWSIVGVDYSRILWHNSSTGEIQIWFMEGHKLNRRATVIGDNGNPAFIGPPWRIVGYRESRILWHNSSTGEIQIWFMEGHKLTRRATVIGDNGNPAFIGPPWRIVGYTKIFLTPTWGEPDIIWHNSSTGEIQIWFMKTYDAHKLDFRATVLGENGNPTFIGPPWNIVGAGINYPPYDPSPIRKTDSKISKTLEI